VRVRFVGRMSTFGGPEDLGIRPDEGLALVDSSNFKLFSEYFLPEQPPGTTGLARRLNPNSFYIACRWDYRVTPRSLLVRSMVVVTNPGKLLTAEGKPIDWGPNVSTGRVADLSPGLAQRLGLQTDDNVEVVLE